MVIVVVVPPTMCPSSIGFVVMRGTPEVLTDISVRNSVFYKSSIDI
jgi:hypothetical protein